jgi:hypothetical protein
VKALRKERLELLAESTRIWKDLAEARAELALERQLCKEHHRHAVLLALERASLLKLLKSTRYHCFVYSHLLIALCRHVLRRTGAAVHNLTLRLFLPA